jgi:hypothetical protein
MKTNEIDLNVPEGTENKEDYLMEQIEEELPQKKKKITVEQIFMALGIGLLATVILIILLETIVRVFI